MTDEEIAQALVAEIERQYHDEETDHMSGAYVYTSASMDRVGIDGIVDMLKVAAIARTLLGS